jgi:glycosyltransferase involved in cell wall biosynthesis
VERPIVSPKVLHVLAPAREGGAERVVAMMSAGQRRDGVHVAAVITPGEADGHPFKIRLQALGVPVTSIVVAGRGYLKEYRLLHALIESVKPQIVHTHGYRSDIIGGAVARARNIPTVSTAHGFTGGGRRNRLYEWIQRQALRHASAVIAVSKPLAQVLADAGVPRAKIYCVPNAFTPPHSALPRAEARHRLGLARDKLVVGWVGRLSREKGADVMIDALVHANPAWQLSIIGDGPERNALQQRAAKLGVADRITWHGLIENAGSLLAAFDAFVLSSRTEGTPITLFEAMHAGVPIVATRVGGVPDVVGPSHAILVPRENPPAIARALDEVVSDASSATRRSALAHERLLQSFSTAAWLEAIDAVYDAARADRS